MGFFSLFYFILFLARAVKFEVICGRRCSGWLLDDSTLNQVYTLWQLMTLDGLYPASMSQRDEMETLIHDAVLKQL